MSLNHPRRLAVAAIGALLISPLAACGGDDKPSASASQSVSAPPSGSSSATGTPVAKKAFVDRVLAAIDTKNTVHMEIAGGSFLTAVADLAYGGANPSSKITASLLGGEQVIVVADGVVYLQVAKGGKFTVVDKDTPTLGPLVSTFQGLGPRESIDGIEGGISSITEVGPKTVDGQELTEYSVTVDTAKLTGALKLLAGTAGASADLAMQFFTDADGLISQITFPISGEAVEISFTDWDKPVEVEAPPASEIQK